MSSLGSLIGSATATGVSETLDGVGSAAIKLRTAITGQIPPEKAADIEMHFADITARLSEAQNKVNAVEAASPSFFVAGARPAIMWICALGLAYAFLLHPFLSWASINWKWQSPPDIDSSILMTLITGMLGLAGMRSYEKTKDVQNKH